MTNSAPPPSGDDKLQSTTPEAKNSWSIQRIAVLGAGVFGGIVVLIFLIGLALAIFSDVDATAARIEIVKNTVIIIMSLEGLLIVAALAILIVQVGRLINLLQSKAKPVLENTQEAVNSARGTVEFVGETITEPIIKLGAFMAGARVLISEVGGIRRAIQHDGKEEPNDEG